jgi:hypothetical protein
MAAIDGPFEREFADRLKHPQHHGARTLMTALSKIQHLDGTLTPKRILALDGGGIRGYLTLQYLAGIEKLLRQRTGRKDLLLCEYFDLIGGTSTGAIIAAMLACGKSVAEVTSLYDVLGPTVFEQHLHIPLLAPKFPDAPLHKLLDEQLGSDTTLGSERLRTGLMVMTKRLDTGSPWPLHNHPGARYAAQDGALRLGEVVRASTAAPTYFKPEEIAIHSRDGGVTQGAFVDGGVTPFNDPALQMLMLVALQGHGFCWQRGADKLLLISIGTGTFRQPLKTEDIMKMSAAEQGLRSLQSLMDDCSRVNHTMLQWLTQCLTPWTIDRAVQDMRMDSQSGPKLATYVRYNVLLDQAWLKAQLNESRTSEQLVKLAEMDNFENLAELGDLGTKAAAVQVMPHHFPAPFDIS